MTCSIPNETITGEDYIGQELKMLWLLNKLWLITSRILFYGTTKKADSKK